VGLKTLAILTSFILPFYDNKDLLREPEVTNAQGVDTPFIRIQCNFSVF
jgi:hypothetical protein